MARKRALEVQKKNEYSLKNCSKWSDFWSTMQKDSVLRAFFLSAFHRRNMYIFGFINFENYQFVKTNEEITGHYKWYNAISILKQMAWKMYFPFIVDTNANEMGIKGFNFDQLHKINQDKGCNHISVYFCEKRIVLLRINYPKSIAQEIRNKNFVDTESMEKLAALLSELEKTKKKYPLIWKHPQFFAKSDDLNEHKECIAIQVKSFSEVFGDFYKHHTDVIDVEDYTGTEKQSNEEASKVGSFLKSFKGFFD